MPPQGSHAGPMRSGEPFLFPGTLVRVDVVVPATLVVWGVLLWPHALVGIEHEVVDRVEALGSETMVDEWCRCR